MAILRWIPRAKENMQRLAFLKAITLISSTEKVFSQTEISEALGKLVRKKVPWPKNISEDERKELREYLNKGPKRSGNANFVETQFLYLFQGLPSRTGCLTDHSVANYDFPYLAVCTRLLRPNNYARSSFGDILFLLMSDKEKESFSSIDRINNPFILTPQQKIFFLYIFVSSDGDVQARLQEKLINLNRGFSRETAGRLLINVFQDLVDTCKRLVISGKDLQELNELRDSVNKLRCQKATSHAGPREQLVTMRLESLVDMGILTKEFPDRYLYNYTEFGIKFLKEFIKNKDINNFLKRKFFSKVVESMGFKAKMVYDSEEIFEMILGTYKKLRGQMGFAPFEEIFLLANISHLFSKEKKYFELEMGENVLKEMQKKHPDKVMFNIDRRGSLSYLKVEEHFLTSVVRNHAII